MNIEKVKRNEKKSSQMQIRIKPSVSKWMKKHNVSPSKVFDEAIKELMEKDPKEKDFDIRNV